MSSPQLIALPHVIHHLSELLDYARPALWSIPRACERPQSTLALLDRLGAREPHYIDRHYKAHLFSSALVKVVESVGHGDSVPVIERKDLQVVQWLYAYLPTGNASLVMEAAARRDKLHILQ